MNILYLVSAAGNPLYEGRYQLYDRYMTYGQQSFIFDLIVGLAQRGECVTLAVEDSARFPLTLPLRPFCTVVDPSSDAIQGEFDLILLDEGSDRLLDFCPPDVPLVRIVHNPALPLSDRLLGRCQQLICLTERAAALLAPRTPAEKRTVVHQGIDLQRFQPPLDRAIADPAAPRVLIYSRLDADRSPTIWRMLELLVPTNASVTVLGDGPDFWKINDRFGSRLTLMHFVPCTSMHRIIPHFDVVISSARGVMEALATGVVALCGGNEYAGRVSSDTIREHLRVNITGFGMGIDPINVVDDVFRAPLNDVTANRQLAEDFCSVQTFIDGVLRAGGVK